MTASEATADVAVGIMYFVYAKAGAPSKKQLRYLDQAASSVQLLHARSTPAKAARATAVTEIGLRLPSRSLTLAVCNRVRRRRERRSRMRS